MKIWKRNNWSGLIIYIEWTTRGFQRKCGSGYPYIDEKDDELRKLEMKVLWKPRVPDIEEKDNGMTERGGEETSDNVERRYDPDFLDIHSLLRFLNFSLKHSTKNYFQHDT